MLQGQAIDPKIFANLIDILNNVSKVPRDYKNSHNPACHIKVHYIEECIQADNRHRNERPEQNTKWLLGHVVNDQFGGLLSINDAKDGVDCRRNSGGLEAEEQHNTSKNIDGLQADQMANCIAPAKSLVPSFLGWEGNLCHKTSL